MMIPRSRAHVAATCIVASLLTTSLAQADEPTFDRLGYLDVKANPRGSLGLGLSSDGSIVVGYSYVWDSNLDLNECHGFEWTSGTGMTDLGLLPDGLEASSAHAVSDDGTIVAGAMGFVLGDYYEIRNGLRWTTANTNPEAHLIDKALSANAVTPDGTLIVGATRQPLPWPVVDSAFYYTDDKGVVELGYLPNGSYSWGEDVSADGSVIVGWGDGDGAIAAMRWTEQSGMQFLDGQEPDVPSQAFGVSANGRYVIGIYGDDAMRWSAANGFESLGRLGDAWRSYAIDCSADGSVIVGYNLNLDDSRVAFIWDADHGMRNLQDVLTSDYGLDLTGWNLTDATAISDDGTTIVGYARAPEGHVEAWRAHAPRNGGSTFELAYAGPCPNGGRSGITWTGAEPNGRVALVYARNTGAVVINKGPCPGIELGLGSKLLQLAFTAMSDANGEGARGFFTPPAACGGYLQLVDLTRCETSNVTRVE